MILKEEITDEEKLAIDELRKRLKSELEQDLYDDIPLFRRFLAARDFNVDNAESMLRKHLEWRKKYDVRNMCNFKKTEVIEKYFVYDLIGHDKEGRPIRYCPVGNIDFIGIVASLKFEDLLKEVIYEMEVENRILKEQSEKIGRNVDNIFYVLDLKNISFAQVTEKRSVAAFIFIVNHYMNNYPERHETGYVLNAPIYFNTIYTILKTIFPSKMMNRIFIYSDDSYKKDILKLVDADQLPAFLGGNQTDPDGNPLCLSRIRHGGEPVPEKYYIIKSKRSMYNLPGVQKVTLSRAAFHEVKLDVKEPSSYLEWEFEIKCRDIGFGIFYNKIVNGEEQITELVPIQRMETEEHPETGTLKCEHPGIYVIVFDNTYSWIRAKEIYFRVKIVPPEDYDKEIKQE